MAHSLGQKSIRINLALPCLLAKVATGGYSGSMTTVSIKEARNRLTSLARLVEKGKTIVVTRNGKPVFDLVPHRLATGLRLKAVEDFKRKYKINAIVSHCAEDFDAPLAEDFLLKLQP